MSFLDMGFGYDFLLFEPKPILFQLGKYWLKKHVENNPNNPQVRHKVLELLNKSIFFMRGHI